MAARSPNSSTRFGRGYGQDTISDAGGTDVLKFNADTAPSDIVLSRTGSNLNDLTASIAGTTDKIVIGGYFLTNVYGNTPYQVESFQFSDGTLWSVAGFKLGSSGNDTVTGTTGNDTFYGSPGTDTLTGAGGYDTYKFGPNFGQTVANNLASDGVTTANGEVDFLSGISTNQLWFLQSGNDLQIDLLGTTEKITVAGWFGGNARAQVQSFNTTDGSKLDTQVAQLVSAMATYSANNPGFNPTTATTMPPDSSLQSTLAAAWHH